MGNPLLLKQALREIRRQIREHGGVMVGGPTGCGKTTAVPPSVLELIPAHKLIGITQPRRLPTERTAHRLAELSGSAVGELVGYQMRHANLTGPRTRIKVMTEGVLEHELLTDPRLQHYGAVCLDEVHERTAHMDVCMTLVREARRLRPDLVVVVMTANVDEKLAKYFDIPVVRIKGRPYHVQTRFEDRPVLEVIHAAVEKAVTLLPTAEGDILIFMPDYPSIADTVARLRAHPTVRALGVNVCKLYGNQPPEDQAQVMRREGRSVIVATNVMETSITLERLQHVINSGLSNEMRYHPSRGVSRLAPAWHAQTVAKQREGRVGRVMDGECHHLFTKPQLYLRRKRPIPEILRIPLDEELLRLMSAGRSYEQVCMTRFPAPPRIIAWEDAAETLRRIGALDEQYAMTPLGTKLSRIPLPPITAAMILAGQRFFCTEEVSVIAAALASRTIFVRTPGAEAEADGAHETFRHESSDLLTILNAFRAWQRLPPGDRPAFSARHHLHDGALREVEAVTRQTFEIIVQCDMAVFSGTEESDIRKAVTAGLAGNLLVLEEDGEHYVSRKGQRCRIFPGSCLFGRKRLPTFVVAAELMETSEVYARNVQEVHVRELEELLPDDDHWQERRGKGRKK